MAHSIAIGDTISAQLKILRAMALETNLWLYRSVISLSIFCLLESYSFGHAKIIQQPEAKCKLFVWPPESYSFVHFGGPFLTPQGGRFNHSPGGQTNNFHLVLCFPYFRQISFENNKKLIENHVGTPVAKLRIFSNFGDIFCNITCYVFILFFSSFLGLCDVVVVPTNKEN